MASPRRIVVTGLGLLSPLGNDRASFWQALSERRSGISGIDLFDASEFPSRIGGQVKDFEPKSYLEGKQRKSLRMMCRTIQLAVAAAKAALDDGQVDKSALDPTRFGVEFGAGLMAMELDELADASALSTNTSSRHVDLKKWGSEGLELIQPLFMLKYLPNMLASHVSMLHDAQGPNNTITESDAAGTLALGEAFRILQRDGADFFLVGGADSKLNPLSFVRLSLFEQVSTRNDDPAGASRPFDKDRDGLVVGEGAAVLVVEELEHARKRGASILAEVVGFGSAFDVKKDGSGYTRAVNAALKEANIEPSQLDHVNAQGLSTSESDVCEAHGLRASLGEANVPLFAGKSYFGNISAGAGTMELACGVLSLHHGLTPTTLNCDNVDPECPVSVLSGEPRPLEKEYILKTSATQMGQCAAVVLRRWK